MGGALNGMMPGAGGAPGKLILMNLDQEELENLNWKDWSIWGGAFKKKDRDTMMSTED